MLTSADEVKLLLAKKKLPQFGLNVTVKSTIDKDIVIIQDVFSMAGKNKNKVATK